MSNALAIARKIRAEIEARKPIVASSVHVRILRDGGIQAQRWDGQPLTDADRDEARRIGAIIKNDPYKNLRGKPDVDAPMSLYPNHSVYGWCWCEPTLFGFLYDCNSCGGVHQMWTHRRIDN